MLVKGSQSHGNEESLGKESEERNEKEGNKTEHRILGNILIDLIESYENEPVDTEMEQSDKQEKNQGSIMLPVPRKVKVSGKG